MISWPGWAEYEKRSNTNNVDEQRAKTAVQSPWVYSDISAIANEASVAELIVKERVGKELRDVDNHPLELLWEAPNEHMGRSFLVSFWVWSYTLASKAYLYWMPDSSGNIIEVWPVPPFMIAPIPAEKEFIGGYAFKSGPASEPLFIPREYITFSHSVNIFDVRDGLSFLVAAMLGIETDLAAAAWNRNFFKESNGIPDGFISVPKDTLDPDLARIRSEIRDFFGGTKRGVAIARGGDLKYEPWGRTQKDAEFLGSREFDRKATDRVLLFPEGYWSETANRANAEQAVATMIRGAVWPLLVRLQEDMNVQGGIVKRWLGEQYRAEFKDIRPEDRQLKLQELQFYEKIEMVNELRKRVGDDPLDDPRGLMFTAEIQKGTPLPATPAAEATEAYIAEQEAAVAEEEPATEEEGLPTEEGGGAAPSEEEDVSPMGEEGAPPTAEEAPVKIALTDNLMRDAGFTKNDGGWDLDLAATHRMLWERKAIKSLRRFGKAAVKFESNAIPFPEQERIIGGLREATTVEGIKAAFMKSTRPRRMTIDQLAEDSSVLERAKRLREEAKAAGPATKDQDASERAMFAKLGQQGKLRAKNKEGERVGPREPKAGGGGDSGAVHEEKATPEQQIRNAEDKIRKQHYESAFVVDEEGNVLLEKDGGKSTVTFSDDDIAKIKGKNIILTHNHPGGWDYPPNDPRRNGSSFSPEDINMAVEADVREMRAVTPTRRYYMKRPPGGWSAAKIRQAHSKANGAVRSEFQKAINAGHMTIAEAESQHHHRVWSQVAKTIGADYGYTED